MVQRLNCTLFQPAGKLQVPSAFHLPPLLCWFTFTVASWVPFAFQMTKGAVVERSLAEVHHASIVLVAAAGR